MNWFADRTIDFFVQNFPSWQALLIGAPVGLAWSLASLWFAGRLKRRGMMTGYTRKVFHFLIFSTVAALQWRLGTPAVCLFGGMCTLVVFFAIWRGPGNMLYEAIARQKDDPHRTFFVIVPYFTTLVGGLASNIFFGSFAIAGYLVTGLADAVAEPVGTMMGKHTYPVPSLRSVPTTRSWEGSLAVFLFSVIALCLAAALTPQISWSYFAVFKLFTIAAVCTVSEALCPHGWDNAAMQIVPSALVWAWMRV
jgi:phytol kinase